MCTDMSSTVPKCSPHLPHLADLLRDLNTDRDLTAFIKRGKLLQFFQMRACPES